MSQTQQQAYDRSEKKRHESGGIRDDARGRSKPSPMTMLRRWIRQLRRRPRAAAAIARCRCCCCCVLFALAAATCVVTMSILVGSGRSFSSLSGAGNKEAKRVDRSARAAIRAAQIPPPGYPWRVFGLERDDLSRKREGYYGAPCDGARSPCSGLLPNLEAKIRDELRKGADADAVRNKTIRDPHLYFIRNGRLLAMRAQEERIRTITDIGFYPGRYRPFEDMAQSALNLAKVLRAQHQSRASDGSERFARYNSSSFLSLHPRLHELIELDNVSIPFLFNVRDLVQVDCQLPPPPFPPRTEANGKDAASQPDHDMPSAPLPMFGWSVEVPSEPINNKGRDCHVMTFAVPDYESWTELRLTSKYVPRDWDAGVQHKVKRKKRRKRLSQLLAKDRPALWDLGMDEMADLHPWSTKIPKAVWRGTTTGVGYGSWRELPRTHLVNCSIAHPDVLDAGFSNVVQRWNTPEDRAAIRRESLLKRPLPFVDFMKYKAIVDIDGNSWSSRFGSLLCMNSVVIKIAPSVTDYWHDELRPWVHYVPVQRDMSDLLDRARYAIDPTNDEEMRRMVLAANGWCRRKMTLTQRSIDMLWTFLLYLDVVDAAAAAAMRGGQQQQRSASLSPSSTSTSLSLSSWLSQWNDVTSSYDFAEVAPDDDALFAA